MDTSPFLLMKAQAHADEAGVVVEFVRDDMRTYRRPNAFDFAISMFNSFGYFADRADDRQVAAHLQDNVRGGGMALIEVMGKELTMGRYANVTEAEGVTRVEQHQIIDNWTRIRSASRTQNDVGDAFCRADVRVCRADELQR